MWQTVLNNVKQALYLGGIEAECGYPAERYRDITEPVCRVNMKGADLHTGTYTVLVQIQSPVSLGAAGCEEIAHQAAKSMMLDARECQIGSCNFDGRTGLFFVEITGVYETYRPQVTINDTALKFARSFVSQWTGENGKWEFEIREYVPTGRVDQSFPTANFTVVYTHNGVTEQYTGCGWDDWKQEEQAGGTLRTWKGTAAGRSISTAA